MHTSCPQDMLLSWTCRNVFDPKPCLFFPTILVSLIKETTSVHKFCFSGSFHYNICCHKPLGIHRSLSLCLSLSQTQMKSYPTIRLSLCAKERCGSVKGCHQMSWQAGATQCSAGRRCGLASQSHADSRAQRCTGAITPVPVLERSLPVLPTAPFQATDMPQTTCETSVP